MGMVWDAFYIVIDDDLDHVKFGITSGDARIRLAYHARDGFCTATRTMTGLPPGTARALEIAVLAALKLAGVEPVRGREYFDMAALPIILDIADNYPIKTPEIESAA